MIVNDSCQPWADRCAIRVGDQDVKFSVIGLPDRIRTLGAVPINHLELLAKCGVTFMRERDKCGVQCGDDRVSTAVRRWRPSLLLCDGDYAAMKRRRRRSGFRNALPSISSTISALNFRDPLLDRTDRARPTIPPPRYRVSRRSAVRIEISASPLLVTGARHLQDAA